MQNRRWRQTKRGYQEQGEDERQIPIFASETEEKIRPNVLVEDDKCRLRFRSVRAMRFLCDAAPVVGLSEGFRNMLKLWVYREYYAGRYLFAMDHCTN